MAKGISHFYHLWIPNLLLDLPFRPPSQQKVKKMKALKNYVIVTLVVNDEEVESLVIGKETDPTFPHRFFLFLEKTFKEHLEEHGGDYEKITVG